MVLLAVAAPTRCTASSTTRRRWTPPPPTSARGTLEAKCDGVSLDFEVGDTRHNASFRGLYAGYVARVSAAAAARNADRRYVVPTLYMDLPTKVLRRRRGGDRGG